MSKSILSINDLTSRSIGVGGPLSAFLSGLSGYHQSFSYWVLFPLWGLILSLFILLCPVLLPYLLLSYLSKRYKKEHPHAVDEISELEFQKFERQKSQATADASSASAVGEPTKEQMADPVDASIATTLGTDNSDKASAKQSGTYSSVAIASDIGQSTAPQLKPKSETAALNESASASKDVSLAHASSDTMVQVTAAQNSSDSASASAATSASADNSDAASDARLVDGVVDSAEASYEAAVAENKKRPGKKKKKKEFTDLSAEQKEHHISKSTRDIESKADANSAQEEEVSEKKQHAFMKLYLASIDVPFNLKHNLKLIVGVMIAYFVGLFAMVEVAGYFVNAATTSYMQAAMQNKALQIATPEQIAFNDRVVLIYSLAIAFMLLLHIVLSAITTVALLGVKTDKRMSLALGAVLKNIPGFVVLLAICYAVFSVIERYYAHFRLLAFEASVRGEAYFNWSVPFLALRGYFVGAFLVAFMLVLFMSLGLVPSSFKRTAQKDPTPRMLRP